MKPMIRALHRIPLPETQGNGVGTSDEVRADFLNLFNHQRLAAVGGGQMNPTNAQFGQITQDNGNGRQIIFQVLTSF